jgi:hypothetical protein
MEAFSDLFAAVAGMPATVGLALTGLAIVLTSDWRLSLTALLVQYVLVGLALTRFIQAEVAVAKILAGILAVFILYLTARRIQELREPKQAEKRGSWFLGMYVGWGSGPLGLPLRLLAAILVALALVRLFAGSSVSLAALPALPAASPDLVFVAAWLGSMGMMALVLSGDPLRVAPALLTILAGFDLLYASMEPSLAISGFLGALTLLAALAFSYLATVQGLGTSPPELDGEESEL